MPQYGVQVWSPYIVKFLFVGFLIIMILTFNPYIWWKVELSKKFFLWISHLNSAMLKICCSKGRELITTFMRKVQTETILAPGYHVKLVDCMRIYIYIF